MSRLGLGMKEEGILSSTRLGEWRAGGETCQNLDRSGRHCLLRGGTSLDTHQNDINLCYPEWKPFKTYHEKVFLFHPSTL